MKELIDYIISSINVKDDTEFCIVDEFDVNKFNNLVQDGIMISNTKPPKEVIDDNKIEYILINDKYIVKKIFKNLDWLNEDGTFNFVTDKTPIYRRLDFHGNTFMIGEIIKYANKNSKSGVFIEYGVRCGSNIRYISQFVDKCYGVDLLEKPSILDNTDINYYQCYTDEFSKDILPTIKFNFAFIDADHAFESAFKDFKAIYKYIDNGGIIILHDTYPMSEAYLAPCSCNDCYKTPIAIKNEFKNIEILTLPLNPGLTIVRKLE